MPRKNRPTRAKGPTGNGDTEDLRPGTLIGERSEQWRGIEYRVRSVTGASSREYRCPGCDQTLSSRPHVVVWQADDVGAEDRRHWHTPCWAARNTRQPGVQRSRNAPRYG